MLNLIRIPIATDELSFWAADRGWVKHRNIISYDEGRALHHLVNESFGPGVFHTFRLLVPPRRAVGNLYAYSGRNADQLRHLVDLYARPEHLNVMSHKRIESKPVSKIWYTGQTLGFDIRIRPTRRLSSDIESTSRRGFKKGAEIDAFLQESLRHHSKNPNGMANAGRTRHTVYLDWLDEKINSAVTLDRPTCHIVRFRRARVARGNAGSEGPDATIQGNLTVADPAAFTNILTRGVGRHRAYGYGMLLLHPPNRTIPIR